MLWSYILIKYEVYIAIDFIFIKKNYAFIRRLYLLLEFTIMFIMNEFIKFPRDFYSFITFTYLLFLRKLYLLEVMLLD